jgi:hypothetical protein
LRTKRERLNNTYKRIKRRLKILKDEYSQSWWFGMTDFKGFTAQPHRLNKNKVEGRSGNQHTKNKTKRHIHGNYQPARNYKASDKRQIDAGDYIDV